MGNKPLKIIIDDLTFSIKLAGLGSQYSLNNENMLRALVNEAYANMWKDVNKEKYDDYKDR